MTQAYPKGRRASIANGHAPNGSVPPELALPPYNVEAEAGCLGAILSDPRDLPAIARWLRPDDFFRQDHQVIFRVILDLLRRGAPVEGLAVDNELVRLGWDPHESTAKISGILEKTPGAADTTYYANVVLEWSKRRELALVGQQLDDAIQRKALTTDEAADILTARVAAIRARTSTPDATEQKLFSLDLADSASFFKETFLLEWHINDVLVKGEPAVIAGPMKTLKTSILIDIVVSLGTGTSFLGKFPVPRPFRVGLISGESGRRVIQSNARQVCFSRHISPADAGVFWGFRLPRLTNAEHMSVLRKTIDDNGLECVGLDPFYLMILAGNGGADTTNVFSMGSVLQDVAALCLEEGCTPIIAHHFTKKRDDPFAPPVLTDVSYAGMGEFVRQWLLVAPRQQYDAEVGKFFLHFSYGGSAGHSGEHAVDIEVGKLTSENDSRKWVVSIASPSQERQTKQMEREAARQKDAEAKRLAKAAEVEREEQEDKARVIAWLRKQPGRQTTESKLRTGMRWRAEKAKRILYLLTEDADVCETDGTVGVGQGAKLKAKVFVLNAGGGKS